MLSSGRHRRLIPLAVAVVAAAAGVAACGAADGGTTAGGSDGGGEVTDATTSSSVVTPVESTGTTVVDEVAPEDPEVPSPPPPGTSSLSTVELVELLDALAPYPGTTLPAAPPAITGDGAVDDHIRRIAEGRGYRLRPVADVAMVSVEGIPFHPDAAPDLQALLAEVRALGHRIVPLSGHRSVERQRQIFVAALEEEGRARIGRPYTAEEIAAGDADAAIDAILVTRSIPGYSRHHSGLAMDFGTGDGGPFILFEGTPAEEWLRADGFANALRHGFVPSYPRGSAPQGPEPEPWEYVWIGADAIGCAVEAGVSDGSCRQGVTGYPGG